MNKIVFIPGFFPYIIALFLNAFTDLGHKIIIQNTIFKTYDEQSQIVLTAIVNALILLPFILMFTPSGYLSDKYPKHKVMTYTAIFSILLTLLITLSYYMGWFKTAFSLTFLMAIQSAVYSPAKYGYIKELVGEKHISTANAAVQAATTIAILSGMIVFSVLFEHVLYTDYIDESDVLRQIAPLGWLLVLNALAEFYFVLRLPDKMGGPVKKRFEFRRYRSGYYLRKNLKTITRKPMIFYSIIVLAVFWSFSQVILSVFGAYAKTVLHIDNVVIVQGVIALSAFGIISGSMIAAYFSRNYIHTGLIPMGGLMIALSLGVFLIIQDIRTVAVLFLLFGTGFGLLIVPLNAYIQKASPHTHLGTILAGNNFIQNIFMTVSLLLTTLFAYYGLSAYGLFYTLFVLSVVALFYLLRRQLDMFIWLVLELLFRMRYKVVYEGTEHIPSEGALLFLGNHISWIDWILIQFPFERRMHFMMERSIYYWPVFHRIWVIGNAIPMSSRASKDAFGKAREVIAGKETVTLFPEGTISYTGEMGTFYRGFERVAGTYDGHIVPFYIDGIYGSLFSRSKKHYTPKRTWFRRVVTITFYVPISLQSTAEEVRQIIEKIKDGHGVE